jgi:hypothetical protein
VNYFESKAPYPVRSAVTCTKGSSTQETQVTGIEADYSKSASYQLLSVDPLLKVPVPFFLPMHVKSTNMTAATYFINRADQVLGRGKYLFSAVTLRPGDATCMPQSGQSYGSAYLGAVASLGGDGSSISICNMDYGTSLSRLGDGLQTKVVDSYTISLGAGKRVVSVKLIRAGVTLELRANVDYSIQSQMLKFTSGVLKIGDEISVVVQ